MSPPPWLAALAVVLLAGGCASDDHAAHETPALAAPQSALFNYPDNERLPPGADRAAAAIERSPRHGEWVSLTSGEESPLKGWVVYPERSDKAPVVLVIHTIGGLTPWSRAVADQLAEDGFIAVAPDFLSGAGPGAGGSDAFPSPDDVRKAMASVTPGDVTRGLDAARAYAMKIPAANGKLATMGFCWGGSRSFEYAIHQPGLNAAVVFYGSAPEDVSGFGAIVAPIIGFYAGDDARVNATIAPTGMELKRLGKAFEHEVYDGAGHGFVGSQADRNGANFRATEQAWPRALAFLRKHLG